MSCVIFGAGKIARGFIGHLLSLSGIDFTFVEKADTLCDLMNERGRYTVTVLGAAAASGTVTGARALKFSAAAEIAAEIARADAVFTAVGGKNLDELSPLLAAGIAQKAKTGGALNIITCENWKNPADALANGVSARLSGAASAYFRESVGVTEAVVMRSAIEPDAAAIAADPLTVNVQDFWELPVDASRVKGELPSIRGLKRVSEFAGFLERKFYTYNAANGTVAYLGALLGYEKIADAARDGRIRGILDGVYLETATALSRKHAFPLEEQLAFTKTSLKKLEDYTIVDFIERNARDPIRKLGRDDRLVGSARLAEQYGVAPENLCAAIAAAIYYKNDADEFALRLAQIRENEGVDATLSQVCGIEPNGALGALVKAKITLLKEWGWIKCVK
jgi:mannitol-1-phosphate 5-dehydrogenase